MSKVSRRGLAKLVGVVTLAAPLATAHAGEATAGDAPGPWSLIAPWKQGDVVGFGWHIADLAPAERGAPMLVLQHRASKRVARVDVCRRAGDPIGIAFTKDLDFVMMNGATGKQRSEERLGRVLRALAARIDARPGTKELAQLLSHDGRTALYGAERPVPTDREA